MGVHKNYVTLDFCCWWVDDRIKAMYENENMKVNGNFNICFLAGCVTTMALVSTYSFIVLTEIIQKLNTILALRHFLVAYESCNRKFNFRSRSNEVEKHTTTKISGISIHRIQQGRELKHAKLFSLKEKFVHF